MTNANTSSNWNIYRRIYRQIRPHRLHILCILLLSLLGTPLALLTPLPLKIAVDSVIGTQPLPSFIEILLPFGPPHSKLVLLLVTVGLLLSVALLSQLQGFCVWLIRIENQGLSAARNTDLEAATGEIVAYLDDDAYPDPHWLRRSELFSKNGRTG